MKNYEKYTVEDFVLDDDFRDWVQGVSQQETFWLTFVQRHPEKKQDLHIAEQLVRVATVAAERLSEKEIRDEVQDFIEKATLPTDSAEELYGDSTPQRSMAWSAWVVAASILLALGIGWYVITNSDTTQHNRYVAEVTDNKLVETFNDSSKPLTIQLSDGSEVLLSPQSRLRYPSQFSGSSRTIYLTGEAVFSVKRRPEPFMVYTGDMVTKVLGTRFVVRAFYMEKKYSVQVLSGKVSVYTTKSSRSIQNREVKGLILTANQAAIYEKEAQQLTKTLVANPAQVKATPAPVDFIYDEVALPAILNELEVHYGIPMQYDKQSFNNCKITATLTNETLYEKLDMLCKTVSASYEIVDGQILISGKGCE
ncbi:FecR family protein [Telluribacter sp. SYSU D00476]|uniref:FecR family protein n=1 Tax=Telluribacter sp. SYSU D00476 TaxID=2811430 RepID=UPI001FF14CDE|nr:FecR family protein [Telluribacter sp. SYSU D00476]